MRFLPVFGYLCTRQRWFSYDESFVDLEGAVQCARYSFPLGNKIRGLRKVEPGRSRIRDHYEFDEQYVSGRKV